MKDSLWDREPVMVVSAIVAVVAQVLAVVVGVGVLSAADAESYLKVATAALQALVPGVLLAGRAVRARVWSPAGFRAFVEGEVAS